MRGAALLGLVVLAACGYRADIPAPRAPGAAPPQVSLLVAARDERKAQLLRDYLDIALASSGAASRLDGVAVRLEITTQELAIRRDETPSRARLLASVQYVAAARVPQGQQARELRGIVRVSEGYNFVDAEFFATDTAREAAEQRLMQAAADQIARRLSAATL
jgi:hypothetical protein